MGVPKFYRWLSERYPLINQAVNKSLKPEIDCLYLDMNGIVHNCTHGDDSQKRLTEEQMFANVFKYIDKLFNIARPQKLLFMAIDGVAPRAKMNQQRQRRFRSAMDAKEALEEAKRRGEDVDYEHFDSNCITPGTEFMDKLSTAVRYFIRQKLKEDAAWQKVKIIFSGAEVPGEGEHKLMLYIRNMKMQPGYDPNLRHCLYGLDADLIMLSLVSHDPHFCLLREEVVFGNNKGNLPRKSMTNPNEFQFLHISVLREYLEFEFSPLLEEIPFAWDFERVIDDWIFLGFLVGNDFLPHLPTLDIGEGGLNSLFQIYRESLPGLGGYITNHGELNYERLEVIFARLAELENVVFCQRQEESQDFERRKRANERRNRRALAVEEDWDDDAEEEDEKEAESKFIEEYNALTAECTGEDGEINFQDFYYKSKFPEFWDPSKRDATQQQDEVLSPEDGKKHLIYSYIEGLEWVLKYYYEGVPSWKWFYPYRYAPLASDMKDLTALVRGFNEKMNRGPKEKIVFELGKPFKPLEQLLGVLPPASGKFLPQPYRDLMLDPTSTLLDFYPQSFEVDMNGKKNAWEGIALIPFIDEKRLLDEVHKITASKLSAAELQRNRLGVEYLFQYDPNNKENIIAPPFLSFCANFSECQSSMTVWNLPSIPITASNSSISESDVPSSQAENEEKDEEVEYARKQHRQGRFLPVLLPGCKRPAPGYPFLASLITSVKQSSLEEAHVNIFGRESAKDSLVLNVTRDEFGEENNQANLVAIAVQYLGKKVWVDWPYLKEAICVSVCDGNVLRTKDGVRPMSEDEKGRLKKESNLYEVTYYSKKAVVTGKVQVMLGVQVFEGLQRMNDGSIKKRFSDDETMVPFQLTVFEYENPDPRFQESAAPSIDQAFPVGSPCVYVGNQEESKQLLFGSLGIVRALNKNMTADVEIGIYPQEPDFGHRIANESKIQYYDSRMICKSLGIHPSVLGQITTSVLIRPGRVDVGLRLRSSKHGLQVEGYARRKDNWQQSNNPNDPRSFRNNNNRSSSSTKLMIEQESANDEMTGGFWEYSERAIGLIIAYKRRFPRLFDILENNVDSQQRERELDASLLITDNSTTALDALREITDWLKSVGVQKLILTPCTSDMMDVRGVSQVEKESVEVRQQLLKNPLQKKVLASVPIYHLYSPNPRVPWTPTSLDPLQLGDRVLSLRSDEGVPFGTRGTVVAVHGQFTEVVWDEDLIAGNSLNGRCSSLRGKMVSVLSTLNLSKPRYLLPKKAANVNVNFNNNVSAPAPVSSPPASSSSSQQRWVPKEQKQQPVSPPPSQDADVNNITQSLKSVLNLSTPAPLVSSPPSEQQQPLVLEYNTVEDPVQAAVQKLQRPQQYYNPSNSQAAPEFHQNSYYPAPAPSHGRQHQNNYHQQGYGQQQQYSGQFHYNQPYGQSVGQEQGQGQPRHHQNQNQQQQQHRPYNQQQQQQQQQGNQSHHNNHHKKH